MTTEAKTPVTQPASVVEAHTPGPWWAENDSADSRHDIRASTVKWPLAKVNSYWPPEVGLNSDMRAANARLIAAAPELLEAARALLEAEDASASIRELRPLRRALRAAIAKATGAAQ